MDDPTFQPSCTIPGKAGTKRSVLVERRPKEQASTLLSFLSWRSLHEERSRIKALIQSWTSHVTRQMAQVDQPVWDVTWNKMAGVFLLKH